MVANILRKTYESDYIQTGDVFTIENMILVTYWLLAKLAFTTTVAFCYIHEI